MKGLGLQKLDVSLHGDVGKGRKAGGVSVGTGWRLRGLAGMKGPSLQKLDVSLHGDVGRGRKTGRWCVYKKLAGDSSRRWTIAEEGVL